MLRCVVRLLSLMAFGAALSEAGEPLRLFELDGGKMLEMDAQGQITDRHGTLVASFNESSGVVRLAGSNHPGAVLAVANNPSLFERDADHYRVTVGDGTTFDVGADGSVSLDGQTWSKVEGYGPSDAQRSRFEALVFMILILPDPVLELTSLDGQRILELDGFGNMTDGAGELKARFNPRQPRLRDYSPDSQPPDWLVKPSGEPRVTRTGDRYELVHAGETVSFEVQAEGTVTFNGSPWSKAVGYEPSEAQRRRFAAMLVMAVSGPARPKGLGPP